MKKKILSMGLVFSMVLSMLPINAMAWGNQNQTVFLPIVSGESAENVSPVATLSSGESCVYISTSSVSVNLPDITLPEDTEITSGSGGARIQAVDENGTVIGQTAGFYLSSGTTEIGSCTLYMLDTPQAGDYDLQLVYGDVESVMAIKLGTVLRAVDAPVITGGFMNLAAGTAASTLRLMVAGYEGDPNLYNFALMDDDSGDTIACTAEHTYTSEGGYREANLTYSITPETPLTASAEYYLLISVTSGELYSSASSISDTAYSRNETGFAILEVAADDSVTGGLQVLAGGVSADETYTVTAALGNYSNSTDYLYQGTLRPTMDDGNGVFAFTLTKNGLILPLDAYGYANIYVSIEDSDGNQDGMFFQTEKSYENQSASLSLKQTGANRYDFVLTGRNMLLDLYERGTLTLSLKCYDSTNQKYDLVSTCTVVEKRTYTSGDTVYFEFSGTFTTSSELTSGSYYQICMGDEGIAGTYTISGTVVETLDIQNLYIRQQDYQTDSFYFNFDLLPVEVTLTNSGSTAVAELYDVTAEKVVSSTGSVTGTANEDGDGYDFLFMIPKPEELDLEHTYTFRFTSVGETVSAGDYRSRYQAFSYSDKVVEPTYHSMEEPVFAGDTTLTFSYSAYSVHNIDRAYFEENPFAIVHEASETGLSYTIKDVSYQDGDWYLDLTLSAPLNFGAYKYNSDRRFEALSAGSVVLGHTSRDDSAKTVSIVDCCNLPADAVYTGVLYDTSDNGYGKLAELTLTRKSASELAVSGLPAKLANGSYTIEVWAGEEYLGAVSCYISWNGSESGGSTIKGYGQVYRADNDSYYWDEILGLTDSEDICLYTYLPGYAYVRYSENKSFTGVDYQPVRSYYNQKLTLSSGNGTKTIYIQFKTTNGTESQVYAWSCQKVDALPTPEIVSADILVNDKSASRIPDNTDFVLRVVSASQLTSVIAAFVEEDGSLYHEEYSLSYAGATEGGYLFQCELNSGDWPFSYYALKGVTLSLTDISGDEIYETVTLPIQFGGGGLYLDAWGDNYSAYTNQTSFAVTGTATPGSTVTISIGSKEYTASADASTGAFSVTLTELENGKSYYLSVSDSAGLSDSYRLYVDATAPVITSLKASLTDGGNAVVTWEYTEENLLTFLLYRDDVLIKGSESAYQDYTDTNYIAANATGATFKLIAVDKAGNRSDAKEVSVGDTEPPTAPGTPTLTAHGTKSITLNWTAATDNVAVYRYEIHRNGTLLKTVSYTELSYADTDLTEGTEYTYTLYALDRAGNKSEAAEAKLSTATLTITGSTAWNNEYIKESYTDTGVSVYASLDKSDSYYDLSEAEVKLQYKLADAEDWTELALTAGTGSFYNGSWVIEDLTPGNYAVRFYAADAEGTEKTTTETTVKISQDSEAPVVNITSPTADGTLGGGKAQTVKVNSTDNVGVEKIELYYKTGSEAYTKFATLTNENSYKLSYNGSVEFTQAGTLPSGTIQLKAIGYDKRGNEGVVTSSFTLDNTAPAVPENFRVSSDANKISILWTKTTLEADFSGFRVYRATSADGEFTQIHSDDGANYYDDASTGVEVGVTYYYYVTSVDKYGNESAGTAVASGVMTDDVMAPSIVSYLPASGSKLCHTGTLTVSAADNFKLASVKAEYYDSANEKWSTIGTVTTDKKTDVGTITWDLTGITPGSYTVRFTATDSAGLASTAVETVYVVEAYTAPVAPVLEATAGHRSAVLSWTYSGSAALLDCYQIYRAESENGEYSLVKNTTETTYTDTNLKVGSTYWYQVRALDDYDNYADSNVCSATPVLSDSEDPVACITMQNPTIAKDSSLSFDASGSTDNDVIVSYTWDFGDETTGTGMICPHTYTEAGTFIVKLTVQDAAGRTNTTSVTVKVVDLAVDTSYVNALFSVVDSSDGTTPVSNAELQISSEDGKTPVATVATGADGTVSVLLQQGAYTVHTIADGCYGRTSTVVVSKERGTITIGLSGASMVKGSLTAKEMTLEEIIAAGIDTDDPDNQHVYRGALVLEFVKLDKSLSYNFYYNSKGTVLGRAGGGGGLGGGGGWGFNLGGLGGTIYPVSKNVFMIVYTEVCWLKEMFDVELVVINDSAVDTMEFTEATLDLPDGLSLASMKAGAQNETISLGAIEPKGTATARWYVRGDKEGEYDLTAKVTGVFMPNAEDFEVNFVTENPIKVWAGSALHLYVEAEKYAAKGQNYRIGFRLENVSNKDLYNVSLNVLGGKILEEYDVSDLEYEGDGGDLSGIWNGGNGALFTEVMHPGDSLSGMFKIVFDADFIEADADYLLNNMFMHTMEGSTTEINTTLGFINREDMAIIVIPGIMGSELITTDGGNQVWVPTEFDPYADALLNGRYGDALKYLMMDLLSIHVSETNGDNEAKGFFGRKWESLTYALNALHVKKKNGEPDFSNITVYDASSGQTGTAQTSSAMMHAMKSVTENVYLFSYDWRNDNAISAEKLKDLILQIRSDEDIKELYIVAHSMGGLVTSKYVSKYGTVKLPTDTSAATTDTGVTEPTAPTPDCITKIITVGTPYLGTPQGTYMLELLDNTEKIVGDVLGKAFAWAAATLATSVLGLEGIQDMIAGEILEPIIDYTVTPAITFEVDDMMSRMELNSLVQYYHGLYQLLPSPAYGGYLLTKEYGGRVMEQSEERAVLNKMMEHYDDVNDHIDLIESAYAFHDSLGEDYGQVLLNNEKCYFIVGSGQRTLEYLVPERSYATAGDNSFVDVQVESGDGTVTLRSSTVCGQIPDERALYISAVHTPLFAASNTINAVKDLLYNEDTTFGTTNTYEPLEPYTKIKAACPVELTITRGDESLISYPANCTDRTSFGELYLLGSDRDIKVAFVDDEQYEMELVATDDGTMDLTVEYHTGGENDTFKTITFTNVPLTKGGTISAVVTPNDGNNSSDNDLKLLLDNNADGTVDQVLQPGDAGNSNSGNGSDSDSDSDSDSASSSGSSSNKVPQVESGVGGSVEAGKNGSVTITPDDGFVIDKVLVNGKPVEIPKDGVLTGLKPTDKVKVIFTRTNACTGGAGCPSAPFTDLDPTKWYHEPIDYVITHGMMNGVTTSTFSPNTTTTRGMIVAILWRLEGKPAASSTSVFSDVGSSMYYAEAVQWAAENGIVNGYGNNTFGPNNQITREQMAAILYRYASYKGYDLSVGENTNILSYTDAFTVNEYAIPAMQWVCGEGIIQGMGNGTLNPKGHATRAQVAAILHRFCIKAEK